MSVSTLGAELLNIFDTLPARQQTAARWLIDHPEDAALLSMREQARRAGVPAATMTRLAQRLGYEGFEAIRERCARALRDSGRPFGERASALQARRDLDGEEALVSDQLAGMAGHLRALSRDASLAAMTRAADILVAGERVFVAGARSNFATAHLAAYLFSLIGERTILLDAPGGAGFDRLRDIGPSDALIAFTIAPYTRVTVEAVAFAQERGANIVAVTDSASAPVARKAAALVIAPTSTPSFVQSVAPAVIVVECLAALVAARLGERALAAIAESEAYLARFDSYLT